MGEDTTGCRLLRNNRLQQIVDFMKAVILSEERELESKDPVPCQGHTFNELTLRLRMTALDAGGLRPET